jgi:hypothetical protein
MAQALARNLRTFSTASIIFLAISGAAQQPPAPGTTKPATIKLESLKGVQAHGLNVEPATFKGRKALRVLELPDFNGESVAILEGTQFANGAIEATIAGQPAAGAAEGARGFVGIAFRVAPDVSRFECFYLRPTNGRADDQVRRNHSLQYVSHPDFPWFRLRKEFPEKYESYADIVPGEWTKIRIEAQGTRARLFVNGAAQPSLIVNDLKLDETSGAVALWIGAGTEAHFAEVRIIP